MTIVTPNQEVEIVRNSIFLAGPIDRQHDAHQWHEDAFPLFEKWGFKGQLFSPAHIKCAEDFDYSGQVEWEHKYIKGATIVMFWVPRNLTNLPAFTSNVEFGLCLGGWKIPYCTVYGRPDDAVKCRYLDKLFKAEGVLGSDCVPNTLEATIKEALLRVDYMVHKFYGEPRPNAIQHI